MHELASVHFLDFSDEQGGEEIGAPVGMWASLQWSRREFVKY